MSKQKLDLVLKAITDAQYITRKGDEVKVYISESNGLTSINAQEIKDILYKLQDDEKVITIKSFPNWMLASGEFTEEKLNNRVLAALDPSRNHFIVIINDSFLLNIYFPP